MTDFKSWSLDDAAEIGAAIRFSATCDRNLIVNGCIQLVDETRGPGRHKPYRYEELVDGDFQGQLHDDYKEG